MLIAQALAAKTPQDLSGTDQLGLVLIFIAACFAAVVVHRNRSGKGNAGVYVALMLMFALPGIALLFKPAA